MPTTLRGTIYGLLLLALAAVGCGPRAPSVSGIVRFNGQALPSGTVKFHGADGNGDHALIAADGRYSLAKAPLGPVRVTVEAHAPMPIEWPTRGGPAPPPPAGLSSQPNEKRDGKFVAIPLRYSDQESSGLTYTVRPGKQTHDIELRP